LTVLILSLREILNIFKENTLNLFQSIKEEGKLLLDILILLEEKGEVREELFPEGLIGKEILGLEIEFKYFDKNIISMSCFENLLLFVICGKELFSEYFLNKIFTNKF
jgi:hypothetical protein